MCQMRLYEGALRLARPGAPPQRVTVHKVRSGARACPGNASVYCLARPQQKTAARRPGCGRRRAAPRRGLVGGRGGDPAVPAAVLAEVRGALL
jgi:hypothetical protein